MAQVVLPIEEGLAKGYKFAKSLPVQRETPATWIETGQLVAAELAPAMLFGIAGTALGGPTGGAIGGAGGSAIGNYNAQRMRQDWGLSNKFGWGEFLSSAVIGGVGGAIDEPVRALLKSTVKSKAQLVAANAAYRGAQGVALSEGELFARTLIDEKRMPTDEEIEMTALFGGGLGIGLGAIEAKYINQTFGKQVADVGMERPQVKENIVKATGETPEVIDATMYMLEKNMVDEMENVRERVARGEQEVVATDNTSWNYAAKQDEEILQESADRAAKKKQQELLKATGARQPNILEVGVGAGVSAPILLDEEATAMDRAGAIGLGIASALGVKHLRNTFRNNFNAKWYTDQANEALKDTKAVDVNGKPITVYHASPRARDIAEQGFDPAKKGQRTGAVSAREGMFFSGKKDTAQSYLPKSEAGKLSEALKTVLGVSKKQADGARKAIGSAFRNVNNVHALKKVENLLDNYGLLRGKWKDKDWDAAYSRMLDDVNELVSKESSTPVRNGLRQFAKDLESVTDSRRQGIIEAHLKMENPLEVDMGFKPREQADYIKIIKQAKKQGNDGVIIRNTFDTYDTQGKPGGKIPDDIYVVFEPDQIIPSLKKENHKDALKTATHGGFLDKQSDTSKLKHSTKKAMQDQIASGMLSTGAVAGLMLGNDDEAGETSLADLHNLLGIGVLAALGYRGAKYLKDIPKVKVKPKDRPRQLNDKVVTDGLNKPDSIYTPPSFGKVFMDSAKEVAKDIGGLMSRRLKAVDERVNNHFQEFFRTIAKEERQILDKALPFFSNLQKNIKGDENAELRLANAWVNQDLKEMATLAKEFDVDYSLYSNYAKEMRELRDRYINEAGMEIGNIHNYHPRVVKHYESFRDYLVQSKMVKDASVIDKALEDYAKKHEIDVSQLSSREKADVLSQVFSDSIQVDGRPGNTKERKIGLVPKDMLNAYELPVQSIQHYVHQSVQAINTRKFLGKGLKNPTVRDMDTRISETLAGKMANDLAGDFGVIDDKKIKIIQKVIQGSINGSSASPLVSGIKTAGYLHTLANVGTTLVQFGDLAFGVYFQGADNVFKNLYNKEMHNFYKKMGMSYDMDQPTHYGKFQDILSKVFKVTGLDQIDQFGKNTNMHAAVQKFRKMVQTTKGRNEAYKELAPIFGDEKTRAIIDDLKFLPEKITRDTKISDNIYSLAWDRLSRMSMLSKLETPFAAQGGKDGWHQLLYQLKTFMLKQFDTYLEAEGGNINKAKKLYAAGKKEEAAKLAAKGVAGITGLAATLYAANASSDVVRDTIYGRPIQADELLTNNLMKLFLINRYHIYQMEREGGAKALLGMMMPTTAGVDRTWRDVQNFVEGRKFEGNALQGTPLDIIYWHYLGGYEKARQ